MSSFEKLLDKVKKANLISEEDATAMLNDYNTAEQEKIDAAVDAASGSSFKEGYDQGFTNAKQQAEADAKKNLDELLAKCDEDATAKLETVIEMLNNDHACKLQKVYDTMMENMMPISEVEAMDADHAEKFQQAMEAVDNDRAKKLKIACESIKKNADKYLKARENFNKNKFNKYKTITESKLQEAQEALKNERAKKIEILSESVEKYLNYSLQKAIPSKKLISEAKYQASRKAIEKIGSILKIDSILQESTDSFFKDYENKLAASKEAENKLMNENINLKAELEKKEAKLLLESKLSNCTPGEAKFLRIYFGKSPSKKIIEEQIEDARSAYKRLHEEKRSTLVSKAKPMARPSSVVNESKSVNKNELNSKKVVTESKKVVSKHEQKTDSSFAGVYAEMLKNQN